MKVLSRAKRFDAAVALIEDAKGQIEELKEELENWLENIPENLQSSSKAEALQEAIDNLDSIFSNLDEAAMTDVEFPGMMG